MSIRPSVSRQGVRRVPYPGWVVHLAVTGQAVAVTPLSPVASPTLVLAETSAGTGLCEEPGQRPRVEALLAPDGNVTVTSVCAPPALMVELDGASRPLPPVPGCGRACDTATDGAVLFACTPSLLDVLDPDEVAEGPARLRTATDPSALLQDWVDRAASAPVGGAAALVARRTDEGGDLAS